MHQENLEILKDQYWDEVFPVELPYTEAAKQYHTGPPQHSAEEVKVPSHQAEFMPLEKHSKTLTSFQQRKKFWIGAVYHVQ